MRMNEPKSIPLWKALTETDATLLVLVTALFAGAALFSHPDLRWRALLPAAIVWTFLAWLSLTRARLNRERLQQLENLVDGELPELRRGLEEVQSQLSRSQLHGARLAIDMLCADLCINLSPEQRLQIREWSRQFEDEDLTCWN